MDLGQTFNEALDRKIDEAVKKKLGAALELFGERLKKCIDVAVLESSKVDGATQTDPVIILSFPDFDNTPPPESTTSTNDVGARPSEVAPSSSSVGRKTDTTTKESRPNRKAPAEQEEYYEDTDSDIGRDAAKPRRIMVEDSSDESDFDEPADSAAEARRKRMSNVEAARRNRAADERASLQEQMNQDFALLEEERRKQKERNHRRRQTSEDNDEPRRSTRKRHLPDRFEAGDVQNPDENDPGNGGRVLRSSGSRPLGRQLRSGKVVNCTKKDSPSSEDSDNAADDFDLSGKLGDDDENDEERGEDGNGFVLF